MSRVGLYGQHSGQSDVDLWTSEVAEASAFMGADLAGRDLEFSCLTSCIP